MQLIAFQHHQKYMLYQSQHQNENPEEDFLNYVCLLGSGLPLLIAFCYYDLIHIHHNVS